MVTLYDRPVGIRHFRIIDIRNIKINDNEETLRRHLLCAYNGGEFRIFPVPKYRTVFVSFGLPYNGRSTLHNCFQLKTSSELDTVESTNGIPDGYVPNNSEYSLNQRTRSAN